ncbi:hypothetical protein OC844_005166 [Tilletia horrida]|nr:hypothetical protein OC844_005166 [Tilletia horrida]
MAARVSAPRRLATLGMFIIDEFQFVDPTTDEDEGDHGLGDNVGGGGTYWTIGARMWLPPSDLSMVIDCGDDFPANVRAALEAYRQSPSTSAKFSESTGTLWRYRPRTDGHGTTRALNIYKGQQRGFKYLTPKIRLDPHDQLYELKPADQMGEDQPVSLLPSCIHFICSPERARLICDEVEELLKSGKARNAKRPVLVWEPIPDSAMPENLEECIAVMKRIDVFSPNHDEAASFLSVHQDRVNLPKTHDGTTPGAAQTVHNVRSSITDLIAARFLALSEPSTATNTPDAEAPLAAMESKRRLGPDGPIVHIRSGALGSLVAHRSLGSKWVGAYHTPQEAKQGVIKDVTGAGNACLGGFSAALSLCEEELVAALGRVGGTAGDTGSGAKDGLELLGRCAARGSVSAAFVIEQQGLPGMLIAGEDGKEERWNGSTAASRLERLLAST